MAFLRKLKTKKGQTVWHISYRVGGQQKTKRIGKVDKRTAEQCLLKFESQLAKGEYDLVEVQNISFDKFIQEYWEHTRFEKAPRTIEREKQVVKVFIEHFNNRYLSHYTVKDLSEYRNKRIEHVSEVTVNLEFRHLKAIFNTAEKYGYLKTNPFKKIKPLPTPESDTIKFFELDEIEKVRDAFRNDDFKYLVEFYLLTGARLKEPLSLTWDDVDFKRKQIVIRSTITKTKRNRILSFESDSKLEDLLKQIPHREDNLLFGPLDGRPQWSYWWVIKKISRVLTKIGFEWASCHNFRHTYISHLVMNGVPLTTVQYLVGHRNFTTTLKYAHLSPSHKNRMIEKRPY